MGEDDGIPDHVNAGVLAEDVQRHIRFELVLMEIATRDYSGSFEPTAADKLVSDAGKLVGDSSLVAMKRTAFINAAINNVPAITKKLVPSFSNIGDLQALIDAVRLEVIIRRLE